MWRAAFAKWWEPQKIYFTKLYQELYVGLAVTGYLFYKISYGGKSKKAVADTVPELGNSGPQKWYWGWLGFCRRKAELAEITRRLPSAETFALI